MAGCSPSEMNVCSASVFASTAYCQWDCSRRKVLVRRVLVQSANGSVLWGWGWLLLLAVLIAVNDDYSSVSRYVSLRFCFHWLVGWSSSFAVLSFLFCCSFVLCGGGG